MTGLTRSRPRLLVVAAILSLTALALASSVWAGSFCTITSSSLAAIPVGSRIIYLQPADLFTPAGSDVVLDTPGPGNNTAFGNCFNLD